MKKQTQKPRKKRSPKKKNTASKRRQVVVSNAKPPQKRPPKQKVVRSIPKKAPEKKGEGDRSISKYISKAGQFLKEARLELKKVKWPTRKELLASTAVVIVLVFLVAFFLGLVDFGLIKIIKNIIG